MTNLQEVPTDELLSFHDYPSVHNSESPQKSAQINVNVNNANRQSDNGGGGDMGANTAESAMKSFWTVEYYQQFFDIDTQDVIDRIIASVTPKRDNSLKHHLRHKPDLYGPIWISITLIFTIAISGNVANYLQNANTNIHWKYDFHLVSYAATAIFMYVTLIPFTLWGLLKWSSDVNDLEGLESNVTPGALELICIYGYSLFIYIPVSILWSIQISMLQWGLVLVATFISGSVLLFTLLPALRLSRHKLFLIAGIILCHLILAAGFKMYFFHSPPNIKVHVPIENVIHTTIKSIVVPSNNTTG
ncbi:unnamed protein product [Brassicogethes aeneus]|uniref:Protein YIPF n=1 Tax=Brassicogethes aeneus TaxID=1431903 RepID=A0A9P0BF04_BRAAE|nr:unnamed protein product [Brassicogethes aeneus]